MFAATEFNALTAVIPVLSPSKFVSGLLDLQNKTKKLGIQLIFIIDESPATKDADQKAVEAIRANDQFLTRIFSGTFGNPGAARNAGITHISTTWVTFWDADDFLWPEKYLTSVKKYPDADLIVGSFELRTEKDSSSVLTKNLNEMAYQPGIWRLIFRSEIIKSNNFPELSMGEDQLLLMELNLESKKIVYLNDVLYSYNTYIDGQLTKSESALRDLGTSVALARRIAKSKKNQKYLQIIALRLYLSFLKQPFIPLRERLLSGLNYLRPRFLIAGVIIFKQKLIRHA